MLVVSAPNTEQEDDTDSNHSDEDNISIRVEERYGRQIPKYQLYGEAFNVASTHATQKMRNGEWTTCKNSLCTVFSCPTAAESGPYPNSS